MPVTLISWNLKGHAGPDAGAIACELRRLAPDLVVLQEVQWHQARRIARSLGARSHRWGFKHWPLRTWPEGAAVVGVTRQVRVRTRALSNGWRRWSWRRRIAQVAAVDGGPAGEPPFTVVNVHLSPHDQADLRAAETATVLALAASRPGPVVIAGDLNQRPGGALHRRLAAAGFRDASGVDHDREPPAGSRPPDPVPTNWRGWQRGTTRPPSQQLDYVYVSPLVAGVELRVPRAGDDDLARYARLSDHLPVTAVLTPGSAVGA